MPKLKYAPLFLFLLLALLLAGLFYPLFLLGCRAFESERGLWAGLDNFRAYLEIPQLRQALFNTLGIAALSTLAVLGLSFALAYALTHARVYGGRVCRACAMLSLCAPSFLPAMGLIYLFGEQGALKALLGGYSLYGPLGVFLGGVLYTLPFASILLISAFEDMDGKLYLSARLLGAGRVRIFFSLTLPQVFYALISAAIVVFTLTVADFGVPKVLGGDFSMLSTEIFKQVVGMRNFPLGAVVSLTLLLPVIPAFALNRWAGAKLKRQRPAGGGAGKTALDPPPAPLYDALMSLTAWGVVLLPLAVTAMILFVSFINFWPYDLDFTLSNYSFTESVYGHAPYLNSLKLALGVALGGTLLTFGGAYITQRCQVPRLWSALYSLLAISPLCIPGAALGLAYIFAFNHIGGLWGTLLHSGPFLLILNSIIHLYPVGHLNMADSLNALPGNYEAVGAGLGASRPHTLRRVILPLRAQALAETALYFFVSSLTTISALVFIYSADNIPASVAVLQMFDAGKTGEAAAMGALILFTALGAQALAAFWRRKRSMIPPGTPQ
jgi:iron(III) transport system permease protein